MTHLRPTLLAAVLGALPAAFAQEPVSKDPAPSQRESVAGKSVEQWIGELGADSYRARIAAEKALKDLGKAALPELKKAADQGGDQEVQWRARRLVRQIERGGPGGLLPREAAPVDPPSPEADDSMERRFDDMFQQLERQFGIDIPRARFFQDDFFRDLKAQMPQAGSRSQGMSLQIGPDGAIRVEQKTTNEKGEVETKTYEAKSMEDFEAQYPGVLQQNGLGFGMRMFRGSSPLGLRFSTPRIDPNPWVATPVPAPDLDDALVAPPPANSRLGVSIRPSISAELREHLGLDDDVGLMVEGVQSGTLAETLGLQRGDIVTRIGGHSIGSAQDVQKVLGGIEAGKAVEVTFLRKGAEKTATATKQAPAESAAPPRERLERRNHERSSEPTIR
ncbi:MAG: PDZ domain-containing protein [Planctomycetes bacterium]|nr:PDZ domain-containing protein [Planctomycetota bacterium]